MNTNVITNNLSMRHWWLARGVALLLAAAVASILPGRAHADVFVSANIAPPPLPTYVQPTIPAPGYIWTPGYWAWGGATYYWVPGAWIRPPYVGALWTPGYWGWSGGAYLFHAGYWGRSVGYYGGINYGHGYTGVGYSGGYWHGGGFYYNRSVNHITTHISNVYNRPMAAGAVVNRASFNGGPGGIRYASRSYATASYRAAYNGSYHSYRSAHYQSQNSYREHAYRSAQHTHSVVHSGGRHGSHH